ncbi:MAG: DMT family transporter, partial [Deltaproteobacteria bacterium]|nr:DMT family transporter [Deltaproteobacteria bacterium]
ALQGPMISLIGQRLGNLESVFIIHLGGAVLSGIPLILLGGGSLSEWRTLPWYVFFAGGFGLIIVGTISFGLPRIGAAGVFTIMIIAQLITAVILDHFGWLQPTVRAVDLTRILGIGIIMIGTWLVIRT